MKWGLLGFDIGFMNKRIRNIELFEYLILKHDYFPCLHCYCANLRMKSTQLFMYFKYMKMHENPKLNGFSNSHSEIYEPNEIIDI